MHGEGPSGGERDGDRAEFTRQIAFLEANPDTFRSLTSLDIGEARDIYRQAASAAAAQWRRGGAGDESAAPRFPPFEEFLSAVVLARVGGEAAVDLMFRVPTGTARAALAAVLPALLEVRDMPRRFARRLVPHGYSMYSNSKSGRESGNLMDYM